MELYNDYFDDEECLTNGRSISSILEQFDHEDESLLLADLMEVLPEDVDLDELTLEDLSW